MSAAASLGRYAEPAMWILVVLHDGPREVARLLDGVRMRDGPIGPGSLFAAVARLEAWPSSSRPWAPVDGRRIV